MKDMWFANFERLLGELEDAGMDPDAAYEKAATLAEDATRDQIADAIDNARLRQKEGR